MSEGVVIYNHREGLIQKGRYEMYTVMAHDDLVVDEVAVFEGTLEECQQYIAEDEWGEELYIVEPDGFTVVD